MLWMFLQLALIGFIVWLIVTYIPMPAPMPTVITVIAVIFMILYVMRVLGIADIPVPSLRH